jgi:leucyl aminopeptidase (aminopeptidase T)
VVIMQTSFATIHTQTIRRALASGVRVCEFWGITEDMMLRGGLTEDPVWLEKTTLRFAELLEKASEARLTTPQGTDLRFDLKGRKAMSMAGSASEPWIGLPGGEAAISPMEGTTEGKLVAPYLVEHREIGWPKEHLEFTVRAGNVAEIAGGVEAQRLKKLLTDVPGSHNIAELAIGTNRRCRLEAGLREAKRVWGTAHVALGDNRSVGGSVQSQLHIDFILTQPTIWLDGRQVVRDGQLLD